MVKVVINACHGGFGLSPEATLRLYERGVDGIATPVEEYFGAGGPDEKELRRWREYLAGDASLRTFLTVFTPDERLVLYARNVPRNSPDLIAVVEEMGTAANGPCASLRVVEVPDGVEWGIEEYDGSEWVSETHRTWS